MISARPRVAAMTGGLVPVVRSRADFSPAQQRMSTIRHNRARGEHQVLCMADIVATLCLELGCTPAELERRLGMEDEEVERLLDRGNMVKRGRAADFGKGWVPG
jgi:hypothetical protein